MSGRVYDVIVVGAGPAGSHVAYVLASSGYSVAVFEEKSAPGLNVCCTGIVSTECFQSLGLDEDVILAQARSAKFFSPSGGCLRFEAKGVQAYVVDRLLLDRAIASKAQSQGAKFFFSSPVTDIVRGGDTMQAETLCCGARQVFSARAVVLANGFRPRLPRKLGLGRIKSFLVGAQTEIDVNDVEETEIYFGREVAPGSFAWLVPTSSGRAYVGLLTRFQAKLHLQRFMNTLFVQGRSTNQDGEIRQKVVPVGTLARSYGDRVLVVGDAAGQVKPTSGGGIYFGHLGAQIAAEVLGEAFRSDNLTASYLSRYQRQWIGKMGQELSRGYWLRWACAKLSDHQIDRVFGAFDSNGVAEALFESGRFSFDWHSASILAGLRHSSVYPVLKIKRLLSRGMGS